MQLRHVEIKNFRSIQHAVVEFTPRCRVLVGINESGKSNILEAMALLDEEQESSERDVREPLPDESPVEESFVRFQFTFMEKDHRAITHSIAKSILGGDSNTPILKQKTEAFTIAQCCRRHKHAVFRADVRKGVRSGKYYPDRSSFTVMPGWKKPSTACPADYHITVGNQTVRLRDYPLVNTTKIDIPNDYLVDVDEGDVKRLVGGHIATHVEEAHPVTIYWDYGEDKLLPPQINSVPFAEDPETCQPLMYMFELAGIRDVEEAFENAKAASAHGVRNLLNRVAQAATTHFRRIWQDYKSVSFHLQPNGSVIETGIQDTFNQFELSQRSDGFKRFVAFLLMISSQMRTDRLQDALILVDEPDVSLHPSGARYLRDELIRISDQNDVVYSTHSIFMIDREKLGRHLILKKKREKTQILEADSSNIVDEEVLYNALGYSVFEVLKKVNLIFEGWRDKHLFRIALERVPRDFSHVKRAFDDIGLCHVTGVKNAKNVTPLLELANRACAVVSDSDSPARDQKKQFRREGGYGEWWTYEDVNPDLDAVTAEDFIKRKAIVDAVERIRKSYDSVPPISEDRLSHRKGRVFAIRQWLKEAGVADTEQKSLIDAIKEEIFSSLKPTQVDEEYYKFLSNLQEKLEGMKVPGS